MHKYVKSDAVVVPPTDPKPPTSQLSNTTATPIPVGFSPGQLRSQTETKLVSLASKTGLTKTVGDGDYK